MRNITTTRCSAEIAYIDKSETENNVGHPYAQFRTSRARLFRRHWFRNSVVHRRDRLQIGKDRLEVPVVEVLVHRDRHRRQDRPAASHVTAGPDRLLEVVEGPLA